MFYCIFLSQRGDERTGKPKISRHSGRYMVAQQDGDISANRDVYENAVLATLFFQKTQIFRVAHPNGNII